MMTIDDIQKLISNDEHRQLELKKTTGELKDAIHTACAMLNTEGGWLIFGIAPSSLKILGQEVTDNTQRELAQALSYFEPAVDERIRQITEIFPDKETVLTPWRVVNMHMSDTLGGWCFYDETFDEKTGMIEHPRYVDQGD